MPLSFSKTKLEGLQIIKPHLFTDERGDYKKIYQRDEYVSAGISQTFTETSEIVSGKGVLRGIHFQTKDSQAKLINVVRGRIYDVAVDLRSDSKTFGCWQSFLLTGDRNEAIFIPENFAHGFLALENDTIFTYQCSGIYRPEYCGGLRWNDDELNIPWPLEEISTIILSEKDTHNISLKEYKKKFKPDILEI